MASAKNQEPESISLDNIWLGEFSDARLFYVRAPHLFAALTEICGLSWDRNQCYIRSLTLLKKRQPGPIRDPHFPEDRYKFGERPRSALWNIMLVGDEKKGLHSSSCLAPNALCATHMMLTHPWDREDSYIKGVSLVENEHHPMPVYGTKDPLTGKGDAVELGYW